MEEAEKTPLTAVDRIANGDGLQMLKAAVPYLPASAQKSFSLYIKMMELDNVLAYYSSPVHACSAQTASAEEILSDIRPYCNDAQRRSLDQAVNLANTIKMYQDLQNIAQEGSPYEQQRS